MILIDESRKDPPRPKYRSSILEKLQEKKQKNQGHINSLKP